MKGNSISDRDHFEVHHFSQGEASVITGPRAANKAKLHHCLLP
jgi:hypothetical protein